MNCLFCGSHDLSREHVFPVWLQKYIPISFQRTEHTTSVRSTNYSTGDKWEQIDRGILHRQGDPHSQTLKIACKRCNNGWMSRLQEQARTSLLPIISGTPTELDAWKQRVISAWATMVTMVIESAHPPTQVTNFAEREYLRLYLCPPNNWVIWLGQIQPNKWTKGFNHFGWRFQLIPEIRNQFFPTMNTQSTAYVIGKAFFMTYSSTSKWGKIDYEFFSKKHNLQTIFPCLNDSAKTPSIILDDEAADAASSALQPHRPDTIRRAWETY